MGMETTTAAEQLEPEAMKSLVAQDSTSIWDSELKCFEQSLLIDGHPRSPIHELRRKLYPYKFFGSESVNGRAAAKVLSIAWLRAQIEHYGLESPVSASETDLVMVLKEAIQKNQFLKQCPWLFMLERKFRERTNPEKLGVKRKRPVQLLREQPRDCDCYARLMDALAGATVHLCLYQGSSKYFKLDEPHLTRLRERSIVPDHLSIVFRGRIGLYDPTKNAAVVRCSPIRGEEDTLRSEATRIAREATFEAYMRKHRRFTRASNSTATPAPRIGNRLEGFYALECEAIADDLDCIGVTMSILPGPSERVWSGYMHFGSFQGFFLISEDVDSLIQNKDCLEEADLDPEPEHVDEVEMEDIFTELWKSDTEDTTITLQSSSHMQDASNVLRGGDMATVSKEVVVESRQDLPKRNDSIHEDNYHNFADSTELRGLKWNGLIFLHYRELSRSCVETEDRARGQIQFDLDNLTMISSLDIPKRGRVDMKGWKIGLSPEGAGSRELENDDEDQDEEEASEEAGFEERADVKTESDDGDEY
ncbi:Hypothetical protein D9617_25g062070 [Elsinoe fawcettii]|nr:Hypothetical protein D9617_25g062070 [Elsinoe fawcettii]